MEKKEKRKYLLFTRDDDRPSSQKPCAFFATPEGCRNGKSCVFLHGSAPSAPKETVTKSVKKPVVANDDSSVSSSSSSSSSSSESVKANKKSKVDNNSNNNSSKNGSSKTYNQTVIDDKKLAALDEIANELKKKLYAEREEEKKMYEKQIAMHKQQLEEYQNQLKMAVNTAAKGNEASKPTRTKENKNTSAPKSNAAQSTPAIAAKKKTPTTEEEDTRFLFGAVDVALGNATPSALTTRIEASNTPIMSTSYSADSPFVPSGDVMRILSTSGTEHATKGPTREKDTKKPKKTESAATTATAATASSTTTTASSTATTVTRQNFPKLDGDLSDLKWMNGVELSHKHPKYEKDYKFDIDKSWISTDSASASKVPKKQCYKVLAVDCEMCQTTDPLTNEHESNALLRFSIVNGLNPDEVVIDQLVSPSMPITEIRTNIHGIKESDVADVKYTLRHAQAFLLSVCDSNTILVGHGLCHDLKALHFNHKNIIDTAYLFKISHESNSLPSVRDISEQVLGVKLLDIHDSVQDAKASLYAAIYALQHDTLPTITRTAKSSNNASSDSSLLMHRIPESCTIEHIREMLLATTHIAPVNFTPIEFSQGHGKTTITFQSNRHTELVLDSIPGPNRPDKSNKPQKRIYLKNGGYMCLRKL